MIAKFTFNYNGGFEKKENAVFQQGSIGVDSYQVFAPFLTTTQVYIKTKRNGDLEFSLWKQLDYNSTIGGWLKTATQDELLVDGEMKVVFKFNNLVSQETSLWVRKGTLIVPEMTTYEALRDYVENQEQRVDHIIDGTTDIAFDNTGTDLDAEFVDDAIKEVNDKANANEQNIADMKDDLQEIIVLKADKTYVDTQDQAFFDIVVEALASKEVVTNKATDLSVVDDIKYPTTKAVKTYVDAQDQAIDGRVEDLETANMIKSYTYNPSTHVLTFTYYDNTTTSFDLPLESAIVDASYDNVTKDITFTLQSGATLVVPLDDLISGLASETWVTTYFIPKTALKTSFSATPLDTNVISEKLAKDTFDAKEALANKKSVINDSETEYPNSKAVKDGLALKAEKYQVAHFERIKLESDTQTHSSGYRYTSFGGGVTFAGKELYAQHSASGHITTSDPSTWGVIVLYTRQDDGSFTSQVLDIDYETLDGGVRDVNLSVSPNGKYLYMKFFTNAGVVGQYGAYLCVYNQSMTLLKRIQLFTATDYVVWGNTLQSPDGYLITTAYRALNSTKQLAIYRSTTPVADDFNSVSFSVVTTLRATGNLFVTEANIAYWQNKLILFTRVEEQPSMYSETTDLNGGKNWTTLVSCGSQIHAPAFPQYIYEPYLFVSGSLRFSSTLRKLAVLTLSPSGVWSAPIILDNDMVAYSGYNSFVRNRYGFGVMYFEGAVEASGTNLYFKDVDLVRYLPQISSYELDGNVTKIELNEIGLDTPLNDLSGKSLRQIYEQSNQILNGSFTNDFESWTGVNNFNSVSTTDYVLPPKSAQQTNELQARYQDITALTTDTLYVAGYLKKNGGGSGAKMVIYDRNSFANATNLTNNTNAWVRSSWRGSKNNGVRIMIGHYADNIACDNRYDDIVVINQNTAGISTVSQATLDYWYNVYIEIKLKSTMQYILEKLKTLTI